MLCNLSLKGRHDALCRRNCGKSAFRNAAKCQEGRGAALWLRLSLLVSLCPSPEPECFSTFSLLRWDRMVRGAWTCAFPFLQVGQALTKPERLGLSFSTILGAAVCLMTSSKKNCWFFSSAFYCWLGQSGSFEAPYMLDEKLEVHFTCPVRRHRVHSHCCVIFTTVHLQTCFHLPKLKLHTH